MVSGEYQMIILDEIKCGPGFQTDPHRRSRRNDPNEAGPLDLVLTGRYAPAKIIALADTVSEIKEIKHHYTQGIKEKAGIEFLRIVTL